MSEISEVDLTYASTCARRRERNAVDIFSRIHPTRRRAMLAFVYAVTDAAVRGPVEAEKLLAEPLERKAHLSDEYQLFLFPGETGTGTPGNPLGAMRRAPNALSFFFIGGDSELRDAA